MQGWRVATRHGATKKEEEKDEKHIGKIKVVY